MLRRILMAILIACLAGPAIAMPLVHDHRPAAQTTLAHHEHGQQSPEPTVKHDCIGCLTPIEPAATPDAVRPPAPIRARPGLAYFLKGESGGPEIPPPRS